MKSARALVPGRFDPLHIGHVSLIETAFGLASEVIIAVEPEAELPLALRMAWLAKAFPLARVVSAEGGYPPADLLVGGSARIRALADRLGISFAIFDSLREALPVSSDAIRADPVAHWQSLPGPVRPHFQKRLTFCGAESTGKSTISRHLVSRFGGPIVPEHGRAHESFRAEGPYTIAELCLLADRHRAHRDALRQQAGPLLLEDTDELVTAVWAEMLLGHSSPELEARVVPGGFYALLSPEGAEWENDPLRYFADDTRRMEFHRRTLQKLEAHEARFAVIGGGWEARQARAEAFAAEILKGEAEC